MQGHIGPMCTPIAHRLVMNVTGPLCATWRQFRGDLRKGKHDE
jgi:hypothetical protein